MVDLVGHTYTAHLIPTTQVFHESLHVCSHVWASLNICTVDNEGFYQD